MISVLFADLAGFTVASDKADPEDIQARLRAYHGQVRDGIELFDGRVEKLIGDGVFAVFGVPSAHEDDPERAVRSALRIQAALSDLNERDRTLDLNVRIAITTGEAVVNVSEATEERIVGDVVNTASRLQQIAPTGGVVVDQPTHRATLGTIDYQELKPILVRGKADPVDIWLAQGARRQSVATPRDMPFVGRDPELAILREKLDLSVHDRSIQLVTVTGEPGVGKSRLVMAFAEHLDRPPDVVRWRQGRCLPYGRGITFWALSEIVKAQAGILDSDSASEAARKLETAIESLIRDPSERDWVVLRLAPLVGVRAGAGELAPRSEQFRAWLRFFEALSVDGPLVLVFEDLHWADPALLDFLKYLRAEATDSSILAICTTRPEFYDLHPDWERDGTNSTALLLRPLADVHMARLMSALVTNAVLAPDTQRRLLDRFGGNPLFAGEFLRMVAEEGRLTRGNQLEIPEALPLPSSIQRLIASRIDRLDSDEKSLLHIAAVIGEVFWGGALTAGDGFDGETVGQLLKNLARKELVSAMPESSMQGETEYVFRHPLIREVAYSQITRARRAELHVATAVWVESAAGERLTDAAETLVYHYEQALEQSRATSDVERGDVQRQLGRFLILAGDRARQFDTSRARDYYTRALDAIPSGHPERGRLLGALAWVESDSFNLDEALRRLKEAISEYQSTSDRLGEAQAVSEYATLLWATEASFEELDALYDRSLELIDEEPAGPEVSAVLARHAWGLWNHRQASRAGVAQAQRALDVARRVGVVQDEIRALQARGGLRFEMGDVAGIDDFRVAIDLEKEAGLSRPTTYSNLASYVLHTDGPGASLELLDRGFRLAQQRGIVASIEWIRMSSIRYLYYLGRWDEALARADGVLAAAIDNPGGRLHTSAALWRATILALRGNAGEAAYSLPTAGYARAKHAAGALIQLALVHAGLGRSEEAITHVEEFAALTDGDGLARTLWLPFAVRILIDAGRIDRAQAMVSDVHTWTVLGEASVVTSLAAVAEAQDDFQAAATQYADAANRWAEFPHVIEEGYAQFGLGRCSRLLADSKGAQVAYERARNAFSRLGAKPALEQVDAASRR